MLDTFVLQGSQPRTLGTHDPQDESLGDAIQTVFMSNTERAIMLWHQWGILLDYRYDWGVIVDDVVVMIGRLQSELSGSCVIEWPSNTFSARWKLEWNADELSVDTHWQAVRGVAVETLNGRSRIRVLRDQFLNEWKRPLQIIAEALFAAGYAGSSLRGFQALVDVLAQIKGEGVLYRKHV